MNWSGWCNCSFPPNFFLRECIYIHSGPAFIAAGSWLCCVLALQIESMAEVSVGDIVRGYVKSTTESGCFVSIGRDCVARVTIARLSDAFISDWKVRRQSVVCLALHFMRPIGKHPFKPRISSNPHREPGICPNGASLFYSLSTCQWTR
jgi:hypothetical protein